MRFLAFFARDPWLRYGLMLLAAAAVLWGGARLWTSVPSDAVRITITYVDGHDGMRPASKTVTLDRTIHDGAVAQRLQRDLAALPLTDPFATVACPSGHGYTCDAYTLRWYRAGLPVEQASANRTFCATWVEDGVFFHSPVNVDAFYADIGAPAFAGG
jgi:hypothetical protein